MRHRLFLFALGLCAVALPASAQQNQDNVLSVGRAQPSANPGLNAALGLGPDAQVALMCRQAQGAPMACSYQAGDGPRTAIPPELMAQIREQGLLPGPPAPPPPPPPPSQPLAPDGKIIAVSPFTNSVLREK